MQAVERVVIVGGGSAGWLTAASLAAEYRQEPGGVVVTLVESDLTGPIGVGEGTWPSMRTTLQKIGIYEADFVRDCDASFKQGSRFVGWLHGGEEFYYHPFTLPEQYQTLNLADYWRTDQSGLAFAQAVTPQFDVCEAQRAPRQAAMPDYAGALNYGYHLDALKFAELLRRHAVEKLGVRHVIDHVTGVVGDPDEDVRAIVTRRHGAIAGDLFVDCSGMGSLLLGGHYSVPLVDMSHILFNDSALAVQTPYAEPSAPIASTTAGIALSAGWSWEIGLPTRKGAGYVWSSRHLDEARARSEFLNLLEQRNPGIPARDLALRLIQFRPGYRQTFWRRNCVAIGLSAGFVEPLEASALVLVELSARFLVEQMPANRAVMDAVAARFNDKFQHRWQQVVSFLKLHYALSRRDDTAYWRDNRDQASIPAELAQQLELWRRHPPWYRDETHADDLFPSASYQYVLYGMQHPTAEHWRRRRHAAAEQARAATAFGGARRKAKQYLAHLPGNRELIRQMCTL